MGLNTACSTMDYLRNEYPHKFTREETAFRKIQRGNKIFIGTGAGEPRHLVRSLLDYLSRNTEALFDCDIFFVWSINDN